MNRVLVIEDEVTLAQHLAMLLSQIGIKSTVIHDGELASQVFAREPFDLVLLDLNLPSRSGMDLCKEFRINNSAVPIIVLTAFSDLDTKLVAFEIGADDFISKPFHGKELLAKVQVFLRRSLRRAEADVLMVADMEVSPSSKSVKRGGQKIDLTPKEFALLDLLLANNGRVVSKAEIARKVWNVNFDTGSNTIEVYISFLRNKIDKPFETKLIHTKTGFGYYLSEAEL
jgi:two-component system, OmpR family, copper resistance phosphate regulon response regulator CusR